METNKTAFSTEFIAKVKAMLLEEKAKLERLITEGSNVLRELEDLQEGLKETVKAVAEELQIKPSIINKAIRIAHKDNWQSHEDEWNEIEMILGVTKRLPEKD